MVNQQIVSLYEYSKRIGILLPLTDELLNELGEQYIKEQHLHKPMLFHQYVEWKMLNMRRTQK